MDGVNRQMKPSDEESAPGATDAEKDYQFHLNDGGSGEYDSDAVSRARNFYQDESALHDKDADSMTDDSEGEKQVIQAEYVHIMLPALAEQQDRKKRDVQKLQAAQEKRGIAKGKSLQCLLCEIEGSVEGTAAIQIRELFAMVERECRITAPTILYRKVVTMGNDALKAAIQQSHKGQIWKGRRFTRAECRIHFEHGHVRTPLTVLYRQADMLSAALDQLAERCMWQQDAIAGVDALIIPDVKHQNLYDQTLKRFFEVWKIITAMQKTGTGSSGRNRITKQGSGPGNSLGSRVPQGISIGRSRT